MELLETYQQALLEKGLRAELHRRYFERRVMGRPINRTAPVLDAVTRAAEQRREAAKYHHQNNRYQVLILRISPLEKGLVEKDRCREYAFWIKKTDRAHTGAAPETAQFSQSRLRKGLEKRLQRLCAAQQPARIICRDSLADLPRYLLSGKYGYKKALLGKSRGTWEALLAGCLLGAAVTILGIASILF